MKWHHCNSLHYVHTNNAPQVFQCHTQPLGKCWGKSRIVSQISVSPILLPLVLSICSGQHDSCANKAISSNKCQIDWMGEIKAQALRTQHADNRLVQIIWKKSYIKACQAGLPDGLFSNQKSQIWVNFGGPLNVKCWYILWPFGIF
jgi:hypothetical protein